MGKKAKIGKSRKDKFYQLAKEAGYRSRAAFKLLQLNRNYHFLDKSRICVDLCAAPGGWLQVAATHMPLSSVIIGIDLAPIKAISNVITHQEDITTEKCRQLLKKDLNDNKADVFLHDGAPNVGKNWLHDAYQQNMLVLQSFKLASEFLKKGGWFITKVFRSKDYYAIMWVFQQFFKKVESTKPQASRNESAEIFVVCQNYKAPDKIDPKFFDIKFVFSDVESQNDSKKIQDLFRNDMSRRHRGGYPDNDFTLYHTLKASLFINSDNFIELLSKSNAIEIDDEKISNHPATTTEIKECIKDIKLLGKTEIKNVLKWRLIIKSSNIIENTSNKTTSDSTGEKTANDKLTKKKEGDEGDQDAEYDENEKLEDEIKEALFMEKKMDKKKKKKEQKEKQKLKQKMALKMNFQNDIVDHNLQGDNTLFSLNKIKTKKQLLELQGTLPGLNVSDDEEFDEMDFKSRKKMMSYSKSDENPNLKLVLEEDVDEELNDADVKDYNKYSDSEAESYEENEDEEENPLLNDLNYENGADKKKSKTAMWYNKEAFDFLKDSGDVNNEILNHLDLNSDSENEKFKSAEDESESSESDDSEDNYKSASKTKNKNKKNNIENEEKENKQNNDKKRKLSPEELAIGEMLVNSKKAKNQLIDDSFNRYSTFDDPQDLPNWFKEDEDKNCRKQIQVPKQSLVEYKKRFEDINSRPIKKVVEAQARKKRRLSKKLETARKKAEVVAENLDMTDKERSSQIKSIYKRAGLLGKKKVDIKYVVAKKGLRGKQVARAKGVKGPYKVVDPRMKKDKYNQMKKMKKRK